MGRRRDEQGAIAIVMAIVICVVMIPIAAIAVDIGMQRVVRRDMQSLADVMALDMSRQLTGKALSDYTPAKKQALQTALENSRDRNVSTLGYGSAGKTADVTYTLGTIDLEKFGKDGYFTAATAPTDVPNAIKVTAKATVDFALAEALPDGGFTKGSAERSAIGTAGQAACMTIDSYAVALNTGNSAVLGPLNSILGTGINTQVLSSSGILTAKLDVLSFLGILKTNLGVGGFDDVLAANVSAAQIVTAEVAALNAQGLSAAAQALQSQIGLHVPAGTQIKVSDLLGVTQGVGSGLGATLNAFDLAAAALQLANKTNQVDLGFSSPAFLAQTSLKATVGSRPTRVCLGEPKATMDQTSVTANLKVNTGSGASLAGNVLNLVGGITDALGGAVCGLVGPVTGGVCWGIPSVGDVGVTAKVSLAQASGTVTGLTCADKTYLSVLEQASLAPATVTVSFDIRQTKTTYKSILLGGGRTVENLLSTVSINVSTDVSNDSKQVADKLYVPDHYGVGKAGPSGDLSLGNLNPAVISTSGDQTLLTRIVNLTSLVTTNLVTPLVGTNGSGGLLNPLFNTLTTSLQNAVGLTIAGSTYTPLPKPSCGVPKLIG